MIDLIQWWDGLRADARATQALRLTSFGRKAFSQNDEDGIIQEIFLRVGSGERRFIEFGVEFGTECNTALLLMTGWKGLWLDGSDDRVAAARATHDYAVKEGRLDILSAYVTAENIDGLLSEWATASGGTPVGIDLLSIDIDRNDYWVWRAITSIRPRVVIIEYNATYPPPVEFVVPYDPMATWDGTNYFGASLAALEKLGRSKGYSLVGCCLAGVNAFFVADECLNDAQGQPMFHAPYTAAQHYEPPR